MKLNSEPTTEKYKSTICIIYSTDSYHKAALPLHSYLSNKFECKLVNLNYGDILSRKKNILKKYDILFIFSGGKLLNNLIEIRNKNNFKCIIFSAFPGIVADEQLDAFITRLNADFVLLNSKKDKSIYSEICKQLKVTDNGILYGASWFNWISRVKESTSNDIVFFEQIDVPYELNKRKELILKLNEFARENKNINIIIKTRTVNSDKKEKNLKYISKNINLESNCLFSDENIEYLISKMLFGITISSSVVIEAILRNKKIYTITDFKNNSDYSDFYHNSGITIKLNETLTTTTNLNKTWVKQNVANPRDNINTIINKSLSSNINHRKIKISTCKKYSFLYKVIIKNLTSGKLRLKLKHATNGIKILNKNT